MELNEACSFLNALTGTPVQIISSSRLLTSFCDRHFFHPLQKQFTAPFLKELISELQDNTINFYQDLLLIHIAIIKAEKLLVIIGPFLTREMNEADMTLLKQRYELDEMSITDFRAYRANYRLFNEGDVLHICRTLLNSVGYDSTNFHRIDFKAERQEQSKGWEYSKLNYETIVNERYRIEEEFMEQIYLGDANGAIASYRLLHNNVKYMTNVGGTPDGSRISSGITRATVRVAAMNAGLPPVVIDQISGESSRRITQCQTREEMYRENERMINSFVEAIRTYRKEKYSPQVFQAISFMEKHYNETVTVEKSAQHLGLSVSSYINHFKKETGKTPNAYLFDLRITKAKRLLRTTQYSIQQIAEDVGIFDANYFVKYFRKATGKTPSAYRNGYYNKAASK